MMVILLLMILGHLTVLAIELPHVVRHRLKREWVVLLVLTGINLVISFLLTASVHVPGPTDWIEAVFGPLGRAFRD